MVEAEVNVIVNGAEEGARKVSVLRREITNAGGSSKLAATQMVGLAASASSLYFQVNNLEKANLRITKSQRLIEEQQAKINRLVKDGKKNTQEYAFEQRQLAEMQEKLRIQQDDLNQSFAAIGFSMAGVVFQIPGAIQGIKGLTAGVSMLNLAASKWLLIAVAVVLAFEGIAHIIKMLNPEVDITIEKLGGDLIKKMGLLGSTTENTTQSMVGMNDSLGTIKTGFEEKTKAIDKDTEAVKFWRKINEEALDAVKKKQKDLLALQVYGSTGSNITERNLFSSTNLNLPQLLRGILLFAPNQSKPKILQMLDDATNMQSWVKKAFNYFVRQFSVVDFFQAEARKRVEESMAEVLERDLPKIQRRIIDQYLPGAYYDFISKTPFGKESRFAEVDGRAISGENIDPITGERIKNLTAAFPEYYGGLGLNSSDMLNPFVPKAILREREFEAMRRKLGLSGMAASTMREKYGLGGNIEFALKRESERRDKEGKQRTPAEGEALRNIDMEFQARRAWETSREGLTQRIFDALSYEPVRVSGAKTSIAPLFGRTDARRINEFGLGEIFKDIAMALHNGIITKEEIRGTSPEFARELIKQKQLEQQLILAAQQFDLDAIAEHNRRVQAMSTGVVN